MTEPFGAYIHIPFCSRRCDYCAFATWTDRDHSMSDYLDALATAITRAIDDQSLPLVTSIFVGGGTPSRVDPVRLAEVISLIPVAEGAEITIECNPESATAAHFEAYVAAGVNRISFGVQSMSPRVLESLGRDHHPETVVEAVALHFKVDGASHYVARG